MGCFVGPMNRRHLSFSRLPCSLALLLLVFASASGCGVASFPYGYDIAEQHVPGNPLAPLLGPTLLDTPLNLDLAAETAARGTGPAQHVYLTELTLRVTSTDEPAGDSDDLGFIESIDIYAQSAQSGSSLPRVRVAHLSSVPAGARSISLATEGVDLIEYVREGARLTATASGHAPPDDVSYDGHAQFAIEVL